MIHSLNRRQFLQGTALAAGATFGITRTASATPEAKILETRVISHQPQNYHGWPTLTRRGNGELLLVCSGGRESHVCPFGRVELMRSKDNGRTWSYPRVVLDGAIDDRDAGIVETAKGSMLVTTFTSLAYEPILAKGEKIKSGQKGAWDPNRLKRWQGVHNRIGAVRREAELGRWMIRSTDDGVTWSERFDVPVNSPHGPVQLSDGRLLYAGKELWTEKIRIGVSESTDDGRTWSWLATIPTRPGDDHKNYHELHAIGAADGRLIAHIRNHNTANSRETLQSESTDGGKTWSMPHSIGVWGLPSFLSRLKDGRLLMTYGHRRPPYGNQARLSSDYGRTWSEPIIISGDGITGDLGYPSTVQFDNSSLLTAWYETMKGSSKAVLRQAHWTLDS
jgi:sialidase-1